MSVIDAELEICPSFGWQGGPEFNTLVKRLRNGHERRRPLQGEVRHRYLLPFQNITDQAYLQQLKAAFLAAFGSAYAFRVKDRSDYLAQAAVFGVGDGTTTAFELGIVSSFGNASYFRRIVWPVGATYRVNGTPVLANFNSTTQMVEFATPPANGAVLTWDGEFRVIVRFASDTLPMSIDDRFASGEYAMNGSCELVEVFR